MGHRHRQGCPERAGARTAHAGPDRLPVSDRHLRTRTRAECGSKRRVQDPLRQGRPDRRRGGPLDRSEQLLCRAGEGPGGQRFYRVVGGKREQIASAETRVTPGDWHTLTLRAEGDRFTVSFDGQELLTVTDWPFGGPRRAAA